MKPYRKPISHSSTATHPAACHCTCVIKGRGQKGCVHMGAWLKGGLSCEGRATFHPTSHLCILTVDPSVLEGTTDSTVRITFLSGPPLHSTLAASFFGVPRRHQDPQWGKIVSRSDLLSAIHVSNKFCSIHHCQLYKPENQQIQYCKDSMQSSTDKSGTYR